MLYKRYCCRYINPDYNILPIILRYYLDDNQLKQVAVEVRVYQMREGYKCFIFADIRGLENHQDLVPKLIFDLEEKVGRKIEYNADKKDYNNI